LVERRGAREFFAAKQAVHNHTGGVIQQAHRLRNGANLVESRARPLPAETTDGAGAGFTASREARVVQTLATGNQNQGAHSAILSACVPVFDSRP